MAALSNGGAKLKFETQVLAIASVTSCAVIAAFIDQPTTRRENRSTTADT